MTKPNLLLVDDEERVLRSLTMLFRTGYNVLATVDADAALELVRSRTIHVIVSDQRMPRMRGAELLKRVRDLSPATMRILLTGYSELDAIVASVNDGEVFRFVTKPWDGADLRRTVDAAADIARGLLAPTPPHADAAAQRGAPPEAVLVLDDDPTVAETVREALAGTATVHAAATLESGFALLARHSIGVVVSELEVGREPATLALKLLKSRHPEIVAIVLTPFQDTNVLIDLINQGQVFRFLPKPARRGPLGMSIASALRQHRALRATPTLRMAHAVANPRTDAEPRLAARVLGYLGRLRAGD